MNSTQTAVAAISAADPVAEIRNISELEIGDVAQQGDVYLHRVPADWPRGDVLGTRQVAVGDSVGSRHVAEGDNVAVHAGVKLPDGVRPPTGFSTADLLGPVIVCGPGGMVLTHPEHAHHRCDGEAVLQVTYQVDLSTDSRVAD
ncbi:MAG: hypothetical protein OEW11_11390 [Nitrospirota bacterium]|nr:hypothetical protein [Nitrospirota bacterium]